MKIVVIGLNHKSAPIQIRERLSFTEAQTMELLERLGKGYPDMEFALLSTCNRVELYSFGDREGSDRRHDFIDFLAQVKDLSPNDFKDHLYVHVDADAVRHLLKVTSGLDSMVLGESQIIGQVKAGYKLACTAKTTGKVLNRLFHCAFSTGKEVHTTTSLACGRVSVAGVAIELAQQLFANIEQARVLVIGAGQMGELLVKHLLHVGCKKITIINRSLCKARSMAAQYGVEALPWDALNDQFASVDIVVGSAAAEDFLFDKATFKSIVPNRHHKTLLIIDIAVPRNFDPGIGQLENTYLFSVDDLSGVAQQNLKTREHDIATGLTVVEENTMAFMEWFEVYDFGPQIGQLEAALMQIGQKELDQFFVGVREKASCRDVLNLTVKRVVNKILYCFIKHIHATAKEVGTHEATRIVDQMVKQAERIKAEENA